MAPAGRGRPHPADAPGAGDLCLLCDEVMVSRQDSCKVGEKGIQTLVERSKRYRDNFHFELRGIESLWMHITCRQKYCKPSRVLSPFLITVNKRKGRAEGTPAEPARSALRSFSESDFDPKLHCLLCAEPAVDENAVRRRQVLRVMTCDDFENAIKRECERRKQNNDKWGAAVAGRCALVGLDFPAAEVRYHQQCSVNFRTGRVSHLSGQGTGRPAGATDTDKHNNFKKLCDYIDGRDECQYTLGELHDIMTDLAEEGPTYTCKHLRTKLLDNYGRALLISGEAGASQILNFTGFMSKLLYDNWYNDRRDSEAEERLRIIKLAGSFILEDIRSKTYDVTFYPSKEEMSASELPVSLKLLLDILITTKSSNEEKNDREEKVLRSGDNSYLPPALLGLSTDLHRRFASRELNDTLHAVGFGVSYPEVQRFVFNLTVDAAEQNAREEDTQELTTLNYIWDNADKNVASMTGHDSFHVLGGLRVVAPAPPPRRRPVQRRPMPSSVVQSVAQGRFGIPIVMYRRPARNGLDGIVVRPLRSAALTSTATAFVKNARSLDTLWLTGRWAGVARGPSWSGFMAAAMGAGEGSSVQVSGVQALPFINMVATNYSTLYTALLFAAKESWRYGQTQVFITFDQPLYSKAAEIVTSDLSGQLEGVVLRLGGFHLLMSFLGAIAHFMDGSGLEDLWAQVYAPNSVKNMMDAKEYSRALRAHSLTQEAVGALLLDSAALEDAAKAKIRQLHQDVLDNKVDPSKAAASSVARDLWTSLEEAGEGAAQRSRTGRLWWQYFKLVSLVRMYVRAERTGDWQLHLECVRAMLPFFHAAGRVHYAKAAHLYVQQMEDLQGRCAAAAREGLFTVRRKPVHWSGVWTDMVIEQDLMRPMKSRGGLTRGRGLTESVVLQWIMSAPALLEVSAAVEELTGVYRASSEQHVELLDSRVEKDRRHLSFFTEWLRGHSPFADRDGGLQCVSTGKVALEEVNCDRAEEIGVALMEKMYGKNFGSVSAQRKGRVIPLSHSGPMNRQSKENTEESSASLLFMRMCRLGVSGAKLKEYLKYELTTKPAALFDAKGLMRHNNKAELARRFECPTSDADEDALAQLDISATNFPGTSPNDLELVVVDGGHLLHTVGWPRPGGRGDGRVTYRDVCQEYVKYTTRVIQNAKSA
ncbi:tRNA (guanine-N(7)-)-methyltransferase [Frankliniella fusca]|uniref:tRNA (Guanine-N(7)-)-methyltransferase n=1 Tax=Frankliniella fusca TaxID=407009 RepID=A0AAE1HN41_9NEOP|nr:tRNA (guanine-N(7)-)-methyltransferase [Frankliniella fusca]